MSTRWMWSLVLSLTSYKPRHHNNARKLLLPLYNASASASVEQVGRHLASSSRPSGPNQQQHNFSFCSQAALTRITDTEIQELPHDRLCDHDLRLWHLLGQSGTASTPSTFPPPRASRLNVLRYASYGLMSLALS